MKVSKNDMISRYSQESSGEDLHGLTAALHAELRLPF